MIPGVTDKYRLPRLGKIRLGEKAVAASGKEYPRAIDHFSFADAAAVQAVYGSGCTELFPVVFPHDDEDVFFPTARKAYRKSGLFCACSDGETAMRVFVQEDQQGAAYLKKTGEKYDPGEMYTLPCPGADCFYMDNGFCKNNGRLMFMLPRVPGFGVWEISTSSFNSIVQVLSTVRSVRSLIGHVAGVPFALCLRPLQVQPDGKAKTVYVLSLEYRDTLASLAKIGGQLAAGRGALALLPESVESVPDDLYPHAGEALDATLNGEPVPGTLQAQLAQTEDVDQPPEVREEATPAPRAPVETITKDDAKKLWAALQERLAAAGLPVSTATLAKAMDELLGPFGIERPSQISVGKFMDVLAAAKTYAPKKEK